MVLAKAGTDDRVPRGLGLVDIHPPSLGEIEWPRRALGLRSRSEPLWFRQISVGGRRPRLPHDSNSWNRNLTIVNRDQQTANGPDSPLSDMQLLEMARSGDEKAFGMLVTRHKSRVAATVIGMLGDRPASDDVGQEVFVRFYKAMDDFRGEANLSTYLTRIAINLSLNELKRKSRWKRLFSSSDQVDLPDLQGHCNEGGLDDRRQINRALLELKPDHRAVIVLRLIDGYSTAETAELLRIPVGTVLSRLARAQIRMKELLLSIYGEKR